jgi:hypothetical protein
MITPQELARTIRDAHAIGDRKENQIEMQTWPREWQDLIIVALERYARPPITLGVLTPTLIEALNQLREAQDALALRLSVGDIVGDLRVELNRREDAITAIYNATEPT